MSYATWKILFCEALEDLGDYNTVFSNRVLQWYFTRSYTPREAATVLMITVS